MKIRILTILPILTIFSLFALSGCETATVSNMPSLQQELNYGAMAKPIIAKNCSKYKDDRMHTVALAECTSQVIQAVIVPRSSFPDVWLDCDAEGKRLSEEWRDGKISETEYKASSEKLSASFIRTISARLSVIQQQQSAAAEQRRQQLSDGLINAAAIYSLTHPVYTPPPVTVTNCTQQGVFVNCVSQ